MVSEETLREIERIMGEHLERALRRLETMEQDGEELRRIAEWLRALRR